MYISIDTQHHWYVIMSWSDVGLKVFYQTTNKWRKVTGSGRGSFNMAQWLTHTCGYLASRDIG